LSAICLVILSGCCSLSSTKNCGLSKPIKINTPKPAESNLLVPDAAILPLSQGDRVRVKVDEGETFSGVFEVNLDGSLHIPYLKPIPVVGLSIEEAETKLMQALIDEKIYQPGFNGVSMKILQWAKIQIYVKGAVFRPGRVMINDQLVAEQSFQQTQESGDYSVNRFLSAALKGAGGIRPDADIAKIKLTRNGKSMLFDFWGIFLGGEISDIPLIAGDRIEVPSTGKMQEALIRPSQITPPGFQIFMSNLSQPISGNAQAAVGKASRDTPYGSRLLDGAIATNCVGGSVINSSRKILHSAKNPISGEIDVNMFELDEITENANDDSINPYLMPDDGIACFDSTATNVREIIKFFGDLLDPLTLAKLLSLI
jgi:polysaccharide biosynthesis/export protein